jgi:hypothetical protein
MTRRCLAITGSGSLASALVYAIVQGAAYPLNLVIISRDSRRLRWLASSATAIASNSGKQLRISALPISWEDPSSMASAFSAARPDLVIHTASLQSAWSLGRNDRWSRLVSQAGYGLTLPLQLVLLSRLINILARASPHTSLVNACYPDAVNAVIHSHVPRLAFGIGNVCTLGALMATDLCRSGESMQVVGHHADLAKAIAGKSRPRVPLLAWRSGQPIFEEAATWIEQANIAANESLNVVTASSTVSIVGAWLGLAGTVQTNLPGVLGLVGGYPTRVSSNQVVLDLPDGTQSSSAIDRNQRASLDDGITVSSQGVAEFAPSVREALAAASPLAEGLDEPFDFEGSSAVGSRFLELRASLQAAPPL